MTSEPHTFDHLKLWAALEDAKLQSLYSVENAQVLSEIVLLLGDGSERLADVTKDNFVALVREMRERYRIGSQQLGEAILKASELRDAGKTTKARHVYLEFLQQCPSRFYRRIARHQLSRLSKSK
jgi:hypothetical protein